MKYRIVRDQYDGYQVQVKRLWLPIWLQHGRNSHPTPWDAHSYGRKITGKVCK